MVLSDNFYWGNSVSSMQTEGAWMKEAKESLFMTLEKHLNSRQIGK